MPLFLNLCLTLCFIFLFLSVFIKSVLDIFPSQSGRERGWTSEAFFSSWGSHLTPQRFLSAWIEQVDVVCVFGIFVLFAKMSSAAHQWMHLLGHVPLNVILTSPLGATSVASSATLIMSSCLSSASVFSCHPTYFSYFTAKRSSLYRATIPEIPSSLPTSLSILPLCLAHLFTTPCLFSWFSQWRAVCIGQQVWLLAFKPWSLWISFIILSQPPLFYSVHSCLHLSLQPRSSYI